MSARAPRAAGALLLALAATVARAEPDEGAPAERAADAAGRVAVRAEAAPLEGRGYAAAIARRDADGVVRLFAVRADGVDVHALARDARGRVRATPVARGSRPEGPPAPALPRRPVATAHPLVDGVEVRWADLAEAHAARVEGATVAFTATPPCAPLGHRTSGLCAIRVEGRDYFSSRPLREAAAPEAVGASFYARAESWVRGADGVARRVSAFVSAGGRLVLEVHAPAEDGTPRSARRRSAGVGGHGLAVAIADVDLDGQAEVLASSDRPLGEGDQLTIYRVRPGGTVVRVWRGAALDGSVSVAASADVDGDGAEELLAIEEPAGRAGSARLWVLR